MKKNILVALILITAILAYFNFSSKKITFNSPLKGEGDKPLMAYSFDNLKKTDFPKSEITLGKKVNETPDSISQIFYFSVPKTPGSKTMAKISGLMNVPKKSGAYPVIVMLRGYIPEDSFQSGAGTQPVAQGLVKHGYITLAPDFLDFGESASASADGMEARFQTYTTSLTLLSSVDSLNKGLATSYPAVKADTNKIGIWGHSNGGQIALSTLEISGKSYPTVLWAPVSKPFPYSVLYYSDEAEDHGKTLRKLLARFEEKYNVDNFSPNNYYRWIKAPLEINQGDNDQEVPIGWSEQLAVALRKNKIDVKYLIYPGGDHNMLPSSWSESVLDTIAFYDSWFSKN